ncbi:hypothetical protein PsYK624_031090 [Phanerochaete sordida]|uniref:Uncharacterized protein n=1 Tax=Phanerochaete sordida TaxID=48140 RepID=A0A9P3L998_9APHY|nr:hypothetical protein PsYK624_031090 [Phanerochaete sordida]
MKGEAGPTAAGVHRVVHSVLSPNNTLGMYHVKRSTRHGRQYASVIPIDDIIRTCHLLPQWGRMMDKTWSPENVLQKCPRFYVNPYLRHSDFVVFRLLLDRRLKSKS